MHSSARALVFAGVISTIAVAVACGSSPDSEFGSSGGSSGSSGDNTSGSSSFGGSSGTSGGGEGGTSGSSGGNCFAPVEMYIVFDKSGSMNEPVGNNTNKAGDCTIGQNVNSKWCRGINALSGYLNSAAAKDQSAALQFFSGDDNENCNTGAPYDKAALPAAGYTVLPSNSFDAPLNAAIPSGGTPMEAALRGITKYTAANRTPGKVTIGILVTDGDPQGCEQNIDQLAAIIKAHYDATKIRTYVIGMNGATFANLEKIATGGSAPTHPATVGNLQNACGNVAAPCHFWNVGDGDPAGFIQALAAIQEANDGCKPGGGEVNPGPK